MQIQAEPGLEIKKHKASIGEKKSLPSGYKHLMGHLMLTTSPWSILTWITLICTILCSLINSGLIICLWTSLTSQRLGTILESKMTYYVSPSSLYSLVTQLFICTPKLLPGATVAPYLWFLKLHKEYCQLYLVLPFCYLVI